MAVRWKGVGGGAEKAMVGFRCADRRLENHRDGQAAQRVESVLERARVWRQVGAGLTGHRSVRCVRPSAAQVKLIYCAAV